MALSWVTIWRIQDMIPILGKVKFPELVELTVAVLLATDTRPDRRFKWISSPILWCVAGLLTIMLVGLPFSLWRGWSFTFITRDYGPTLLLFLALASSLREMQDVEWFAFANLCGATIYAANIYLFFPIVNGRLAGAILYDANDFTLLITCTLPFAFYFLRKGQGLVRRAVAAFSILLLIVMIIRSGSRGGFLSLIAVGVYVLFFYTAFPKRARIATLGAVILLFTALAPSQYWQMMDSIAHPKHDYNMTSEVGRKAIWKRGLGYMLTHPVLGVGVRAFPQAEGMLSNISKQYAAEGRGLKWSVAHNSYVETGAELGVGGLVLLLSMITLAFRTLDSVRAAAREGRGYVTLTDATFAQTLTASFIAFCIAGFFISAEYFSYFYVLLALVVAQQAILRRRWVAESRGVATSPLEQGPPRERRLPAPAHSAVASTWFPPA